MVKLPLAAGTLLSLAACGETSYDPRGVRPDETLLSVSATGQADTRPDEAQFQAGISTWDKLGRKVAALQAMRKTLLALAANCHGDQRPDCPILDRLEK